MQRFLGDEDQPKPVPTFGCAFTLLVLSAPYLGIFWGPLLGLTTVGAFVGYIYSKSWGVAIIAGLVAGGVTLNVQMVLVWIALKNM